jgi:hypothetical protein
MLRSRLIVERFLEGLSFFSETVQGTFQETVNKRAGTDQDRAIPYGTEN